MLDKSILQKNIDAALDYIQEKLASGTEVPFLYQQSADKLNIIKQNILNKSFSDEGLSLGQFAIKRMNSRDTWFAEKLCDIAAQTQLIDKTLK